MATADQVQALLDRIQNLEAQIISAGVAAKGAGKGRVGPGLGVDTRALGRPSMFDGQDVKWRDWSVVFKSYAGLVNERLATLMAPAETAEPATLRNDALANDEARQASRDLFHLLLHLTSGPALDRVVNCGDGEGMLAWNRVVERYDPKLRSRSAGLLLELLRFDFAGDMLTRIEEFERSVVTFQNASAEQVSSGMKVGMVLNRLPDSELATHLVLNAERLKEWSDFKNEIVNVSKARAAAAGAYGLGTQKMSGGGIVENFPRRRSW